MTLDLEPIKARAEAATHVSAERVQWDASGPVVGYYHGGAWFGIAECHSWEGDPVDFDVAEFIAHARTDVPALVAEVEQLRAVLEEAHLLRIKAQNPGIDMDEMRRSRALASGRERAAPSPADILAELRGPLPGARP